MANRVPFQIRAKAESTQKSITISIARRGTAFAETTVAVSIAAGGDHRTAEHREGNRQCNAIQE